MACAYPDEQNYLWSALKQDIVLPIGKKTREHNEPIIYYNVSQFLRDHSNTEWNRYMDQFTARVDTKVHVDKMDARYHHIYRGVDIIVQRIVNELANMDSDMFGHGTKLHHTGSIRSNVKVGMPHETDYVFEVPDQPGRLKTLIVAQLPRMIESIIEKKAARLTDGLTCSILRTKKNFRIGGVCLYMEFRQMFFPGNMHTTTVSVDLTPVFRLTSTGARLTEKAAAFLPFSLQAYAERHMLYQLIWTNKNQDKKSGCDTGLLENHIVDTLPESKKRAFRVAKFILQNLRDENRFFESWASKPYVLSYALRVLFLQLLQHISGTSAYDRLSDGLLVTCLLDMVKRCLDIKEIELYHPFIQNEFTCRLEFRLSGMEFQHKIDCFIRTNPEWISLWSEENRRFIPPFETVRESSFVRYTQGQPNYYPYQ